MKRCVVGKMSGRIALGFIAAFFFGLVLGQSHTPEQVVGATVRGAIQVVTALVGGVAPPKIRTQPSKPGSPAPKPALKPKPDSTPSELPSKPGFKLSDPDAKSPPGKVAANADEDASASFHGNQSVLLLHSVKDMEGVDALRHIIRSRWGFDVATRDLLTYEAGLAANFDKVVVVNEVPGLVPAVLTADLAEIGERGLVWLGFDIGTLLTQLHRGSPEGDISGKQMTALRYRDAVVEDEIVLTHDIMVSPLLGDIEIRATGLTSDGSECPVIFQLLGGGNVLIMAVSQLPHWYELGDASLILIDSLHYAFGPAKGAERGNLALLRLEDVNSETYYDSTQLNDVFELLSDRGVPFHVAVIPKYVDSSREIDRGLSEARRFSYTLRNAVDNLGAVLVQHGHSHQVGSQVSGIGYEFWDAAKDAPLEFDSVEYVLRRIEDAKKQMKSAGLPVPDIWETPHYAYSKLDDEVFNSVYSLRYEPAYNIGSLPFPLYIDGVKYIPETLGYIEKTEDIERLEARFKLLQSLHEPVVASLFWHPWRPIEELSHLVRLIEGAGFEFVDAYDLVDALKPSWTRPSEVGYQIVNWLTWITIGIFVVGALVHFLQRLTFTKNFQRSASHVAPDISELLAEYGDSPLPKIAILVPAREETAVIKNTILNLSRLDYPTDRFNILVITDEREFPNTEQEKTTFDLATEIAGFINDEKKTQLISVISVPEWYSGRLGCFKKSATRSTKGRALNYGLQYLSEQSDFSDVDFLGVLDADARLHRNVLREAAMRIRREGARLLQGPVLQISNLADVTFVGKLAGLELANYHFTSLAESRWFKPYPKFLAGTNYFIEKNALIAVGGWDQTALVEDAELSFRLYRETGITFRWLWSYELEQTTPNFSVYKRQRERWVRGHLALIQPIMNSRIAFDAKIYLLFKILSSQFRFLFDLTFPIGAAIIFLGGYITDAGAGLRYLSVFLLLGALLIWDSYGFTYRRVARLAPHGVSPLRCLKWSVIFYVYFLPYILVQAIPRVSAVWSILAGRAAYWYKTERTQDAIPQDVESADVDLALEAIGRREVHLAR